MHLISLLWVQFVMTIHSPKQLCRQEASGCTHILLIQGSDYSLRHPGRHFECQFVTYGEHMSGGSCLHWGGVWEKVTGLDWRVWKVRIQQLIKHHVKC